MCVCKGGCGWRGLEGSRSLCPAALGANVLLRTATCIGPLSLSLHATPLSGFSLDNYLLCFLGQSRGRDTYVTDTETLAEGSSLVVSTESPPDRATSGDDLMLFFGGNAGGRSWEKNILTGLLETLRFDWDQLWASTKCNQAHEM